MNQRFIAQLPLLATCSWLSVAAAPPPFTSPELPHVTSWIGNTYPGAQKWVQQDIRAMAVTDDGTVFTNVEWDEGGGNVGEYRDGQLIRYARHTHGWGAMGGEAVAVNSRYAFVGGVMENEGGGLKDEHTWPPKGSKWLGISRRLRQDISKAAPFEGGKGGQGDTLKQSFLVVAEVSEGSKGRLPGVGADQKELYVADPTDSAIKVYDCESMKLARSWRLDRVGPLALDAAGSVWLLQRKTGNAPARLVRFDKAGREISPALTFPETVVPTAFCLGPSAQVLVADDGVAQQIRLYLARQDRWEQTGTFGLEQGIYAAPAGAFADRKLNHLTALGCDGKGNLYLAQDGQTGGGGTVLESYGLASGQLNWRLFGLTFVDMAAVDPANDRDVFTKEEHFRFDYTRPAGREWSYAGYTVNRFKYPQDPRLHIWSAGAWVRQIGGQRILFVSDMNSEHLQVYRFAPRSDEEVAIPSALFAQRHLRDKSDPTWPPHQPNKGEWLWHDANGNGAFDAGEFEQPNAPDAPPAQGWWVDPRGDVWLATETKGIRLFPFQGLDAQGNPLWSYATQRTFPHLGEFKQIKRLRYLPQTDTLLVAGTTEEHKNQHWKPSGPVMARYDGWLAGKRQLRWRMVLPYASGSSGHSSCEPMGFDVAGNFLFVPYTGASKPDAVKHGRVEIFRVADGSAVGHLEPSAEVGEIGLQDIRECLAAHQRANGEFLVFLEDDYKSKVIAYRLAPDVLK
ncbi:MAG TPA: hypothetical protein VNZ22_01000 [Bacillota bacterium]|nr:hypothetical protein [Bacillota bacterium]